MTVTLPAEEHSGRLVASLAEAEVEKDARAALGERVSKIYAGVNERERQALDVLTASLDMIAGALRDMEGGINGDANAAPDARPEDGR